LVKVNIFGLATTMLFYEYKCCDSGLVLSYIVWCISTLKLF